MVKNAKEVFAELKRRQITSRHKLNLNEVLNAWEEERRSGLARLKREEIENRNRYEKAVEKGRETAEWLEEQEQQAVSTEMAAIADYAAQKSVSAEKTIYQARLLFDLMRMVSEANKFNSGDFDVEFEQDWLDLNLISINGDKIEIGPNFGKEFPQLSDFPDELKRLRKMATRLGYKDPALGYTENSSEVISPVELTSINKADLKRPSSDKIGKNDFDFRVGEI